MRRRVVKGPQAARGSRTERRAAGTYKEAAER